MFLKEYEEGWNSSIVDNRIEGDILLSFNTRYWWVYLFHIDNILEKKGDRIVDEIWYFLKMMSYIKIEFEWGLKYGNGR